jgi:hypothetical protein
MGYHTEVNAPSPPAAEIDQLIQDRLIAWMCEEGGLVSLTFSIMGYPNPWAALKPSTVRDKLSRGYNPFQDQRRTGKLQADAMNPTIGRGPGYVSFIIYTGQNNYAGFHQWGTGYMPPRPPLPTPTEEDCARKAEELGLALFRARGWL